MSRFLNDENVADLRNNPTYDIALGLSPGEIYLVKPCAHIAQGCTLNFSRGATRCGVIAIGSASREGE